MKKTLCSIIAGVGLTISTALTSFANPEKTPINYSEHVIVLSSEEFKDFKKEKADTSGPYITLSDYTTQDDCYSEIIQELQKKAFERGYNLIVVRDIQEPYVMAGAGGGAGSSFGYDIQSRRMKYSIIANLYLFEKPEKSEAIIPKKSEYEIKLLPWPSPIPIGEEDLVKEINNSELDSTNDPLEKKEIIDQLEKENLK